jgi:hypothetical protein
MFLLNSSKFADSMSSSLNPVMHNSSESLIEPAINYTSSSCKCEVCTQA